ncbi:MAG: hypothetical protein ABIH89_04465 [Elusimicrobiota bacterium]
MRRDSITCIKAVPVIIVMQTVLAVTITLFCLFISNTLENNGMWNAAKNDIEMRGLGGVEFFKKRQPLARNRLDLSAWHGCQEGVYKKRQTRSA